MSAWQITVQLRPIFRERKMAKKKHISSRRQKLIDAALKGSGKKDTSFSTSMSVAMSQGKAEEGSQYTDADNKKWIAGLFNKMSKKYPKKAIIDSIVDEMKDTGDRRTKAELNAYVSEEWDTLQKEEDKAEARKLELMARAMAYVPRR